MVKSQRVAFVRRIMHPWFQLMVLIVEVQKVM